MATSAISRKSVEYFDPGLKLALDISNREKEMRIGGVVMAETANTSGRKRKLIPIMVAGAAALAACGTNEARTMAVPGARPSAQIAAELPGSTTTTSSTAETSTTIPNTTTSTTIAGATTTTTTVRATTTTTTQPTTTTTTAPNMPPVTTTVQGPNIEAGADVNGLMPAVRGVPADGVYGPHASTLNLEIEYASLCPGNIGIFYINVKGLRENTAPAGQPYNGQSMRILPEGEHAGDNWPIGFPIHGVTSSEWDVFEPPLTYDGLALIDIYDPSIIGPSGSATLVKEQEVKLSYNC